MGEIYTIVAMLVKFDLSVLEVAAGKAFSIVLDNQDDGIPHNVAIHEGDAENVGAEIWKGDLFEGVETRTYSVPALDAGTYAFICSIHPNMVGTLTVK
jgi:plastocyanin